MAGTLAPELVARFYHHPEGSEVIPLFLLKSKLLRSKNRQFMENMERFGLLSDPASTTNPDGLPVGMTSDVPRDLRPAGLKMSGFNCAACHVTELSAEGRTLRIVGAPARFDIKAFYREFGEALDPLMASPSAAWKVFQEYMATRRASGGGGSTPRSGDAASTEVRSEEAAQLIDAIEIDQAKNAFERKFAEAIERQYRESVREAMEAPAPGSPLGERRDGLGARARADLDAVLGERATAPAGRFRELSTVRQARELRATLLEFDAVVRLLVSRLRLAKQIGGASDAVDAGPGRVDAFVTAKNIVFGTEDATNSPVSFPHIWGIERLAWLHWDGNTNSVMERNMGQAVGLGAVFTTDGRSTLLPRAIHDLELWARQLDAPKWPFAIDTGAVARGRQVFDKECASCHGSAAATGETCTAVAEVGTDPNRARNFASTVGSDPLWRRLDTFLDLVKQRAYQDSAPPVLPPEASSMEAHRVPTVWRAPNCYANRTLEGIWATAPFLHNGSVPTLSHLLELDARPATFVVGHPAFDVKRVGVASPAGPGAGFTFDTSLPGNSNKGHTYGTKLSDAERRDLIELLKTL